MQSQYYKVLKISIRELTESKIKELYFNNLKLKLVIGFVSPHLDFKEVAFKIKNYLPYDTTLILTSTAGELCTFNGTERLNKLYLNANGTWDTIILSGYSELMFDDIFVATFDLGPKELTMDEKIKYIETKLSEVKIPFNIDYKDTIAYTLIDGLSSAESFFMEAVYNTGKFPCIFVGGSAGGKLDFKNTYIFNNQKVVQNSAIVTFMKLNNNIQFGIFKSQNFSKTSYKFDILEADPIKRTVKTILDKKTLSSKVSLKNL